MARSTLYRGGLVHRSHATAVLVTDGRVAWIGDDAAAPRADATVELEGAWVAPAFVDAHLHTTATGLARTGLDLTECRSREQALQVVADHSRRLRGGVLLGTGWDESGWDDPRPPTAAELDRASHGGVVYLARTDVHSAVASSALLAATPGVTTMTGFVGEGLVNQAAHHAVRRTAMSSVSRAQRRATQLGALDHLASLGIASAHECGGPDIAGEDDFTDLLGLDHPVERIGLWGELMAVDKARELGALGAGGDLFVDGALGSHTACLAERYTDADTVGVAFLDVEQVTEHLTACTEAGMPGGFHAIGDAALQVIAEALVKVSERLGAAAVRAAGHRIEHVELVSAAQVEVLASTGVTASVQPAFDQRWGGEHGMYAHRLGVERALGMNPFARLHAAGVPLALGSDSPVTPPDPWGGVRAAVEHRTEAHRLTLSHAFAAHTTGGRLAARQAGQGDLALGAQATFAAWQVPAFGDDGWPDLAAGDPVCLLTVIDGAEAFRQGVDSAR